MYPHLIRRPAPVVCTKERLELPDGDFVDLHWAGDTCGPLVCLFHGLEGSVDSPYIRGIQSTLGGAGFQTVLMHFRGCGGVENRLARGYHSGDTGDIRELLRVLEERHPDRWMAAVGFSLGGNALLKYLGEEGPKSRLAQAVAVSVPFDLSRCNERLSTGLSRGYSRHILRSLRAKVADRAVLLREAGVDVERALSSRDFRTFDDAVVAPIFGFTDADDYYAQSSCGQFLQRIEVPTLIIHAQDDPFMDPQVVPSDAELSECVTLELSAGGGHVGFVGGHLPGRAVYWLDERILAAITAAAG